MMRYAYLFFVLVCVNLLHAQEKSTIEWLKFRVKSGCVLNYLYNDIPFKKEHPETIEEYHAVNRQQKSIGYDLGADALLGRDKVVKFVLGAGFIASKHRWLYYYSETVADPTYPNGSKQIIHNYDLHLQTYYVSGYAGLAFYWVKNFSVEPGLLVSSPLISQNKLSGYDSEIRSHNTGNPDPVTGYYTSYETLVNTTNYQNTTNRKIYGNTQASLLLRLSYEMTIRKRRLGIYASISSSFTALLTWYNLGLSFYPFTRTL